METEILIALFAKLIDERIEKMPVVAGPRGPRGSAGIPGADGKGFVFKEHEAVIRAWAQEFALKFEDFTTEQINSLRGPRGGAGRDGKDVDPADVEKQIRGVFSEISDSLKLKFADLSADEIGQLRGPRGRDGEDGEDFVLADHEDVIRAWAKEFALKFEDLDEQQINALRGPKGRDGKDGDAGRSFIFEENENAIRAIIVECVEGIREKLKLRFEDLDDEDIERLRGPRGRDGRDGRNFVFDDHLDFFNSLRLKFSDLTDAEKASLKLRFSHLTEDERATLKLRFTDLTEEDRALIKGARGARGQRGRDGERGQTGLLGPRGLPGPRGISGLSGARGVDGANGAHGLDAPTIVAIDVEQRDDDIVFVFKFSDGSEIRSDRVKLPAQANYYSVAGGGGGGSNKVNYDTRVDEPSDDVTYVGKTIPGNAPADPLWQIQKITIVGTETIIEFADSDAKFDNVWDDRASLTYG